MIDKRVIGGCQLKEGGPRNTFVQVLCDCAEIWRSYDPLKFSKYQEYRRWKEVARSLKIHSSVPMGNKFMGQSALYSGFQDL